MTNAANLIFYDKVFLTITALKLLKMLCVAILARVAICSERLQSNVKVPGQIR